MTRAGKLLELLSEAVSVSWKTDGRVMDFYKAIEAKHSSTTGKYLFEKTALIEGSRKYIAIFEKMIFVTDPSQTTATKTGKIIFAGTVAKPLTAEDHQYKFVLTKVGIIPTITFNSKSVKLSVVTDYNKISDVINLALAARKVATKARVSSTKHKSTTAKTNKASKTA